MKNEAGNTLLLHLFLSIYHYRNHELHPKELPTITKPQLQESTAKKIEKKTRGSEKARRRKEEEKKNSDDLACEHRS